MLKMYSVWLVSSIKPWKKKKRHIFNNIHSHIHISKGTVILARLYLIFGNSGTMTIIQYFWFTNFVKCSVGSNVDILTIRFIMFRLGSIFPKCFVARICCLECSSMWSYSWEVDWKFKACSKGSNGVHSANMGGVGGLWFCKTHEKAGTHTHTDTDKSSFDSVLCSARVCRCTASLRCAWAFTYVCRSTTLKFLAMFLGTSSQPFLSSDRKKSWLR